MNDIRDRFLRQSRLGEPVIVDLHEWPELDGKVFVRPLSAAEGAAVWWSDDDDGVLEAARAVAAAACDAEGNRIFADDDAAALAACDWRLIARVNAAVLRVNALPQRDEADPTLPPPSEQPSGSA